MTEPAEPLLRLEDVGVTLSRRPILTGVNLELAAGEFAGLIGSNGAGKTTLLRVILGLLAPASGRVSLGRDPASGHGSAVGYVPQTITLDQDMPLRARDLVALGYDGHRLGFSLGSRRKRELVEEMLEAVGASHFANSRIGNLSGGEQQRLLIAHALVGRPRLLLLDEPLANLDIRSEQEIVEILGRLAKDQRIAVLISTHDMNPLLPVMDKIVYLAGGRAASGSVADVVSTEGLTRLYGHQVDVIQVRGRILVVAASDSTRDRSHHSDRVIEVV